MAILNSNRLVLVSRRNPPLPPLTASGPVLRAAIYARKSTDEKDRDAENKSVRHQISQAQAYAASKGWKVDDEYIFDDEGISGAEYVNRPGLARLLACLPKRGKPPFEALIMSESSRLGRDMTRNAAFVVNIIECGVQIFYYLTDEEEKADTPEQKIMLTLRSYASEVERLKAGQRSRAVLESKAKHGYNTGGVVYGYDNFAVNGKNSRGEEVRLHVDYRINEQQADVVCRIFKMYLAGHGHAAIAKTMNGDPKFRIERKKYFDGKQPPGPRTGTGSWAPSSIRAMLYNERYCGKVPYGRLRRVYRGGTQKRVVVGKATFADRSDLRIVSDELWGAVHKRLKAVRQTYVRENGGTLWGRPEAGRESKYLLSGIARCGTCGASMIATRGLGNGRAAVARYACSYNSNRGKTVCSNTWREPQEILDSNVLASIERTILCPTNVSHTLKQAWRTAKARRNSEPDTTKKLEAEIKREKRQRDRLIAECAAGVQIPGSLLADLQNRDHRIAALESELARSPHRLEFDTKDLERLRARMTDRIGKFHDLLHANVSLARQVLRKLLVGPIKCVPVVQDGRKRYAILGETRLGPLLVPERVTLVPRKGLEPPQCCHR